MQEITGIDYFKYVNYRLGTFDSDPHLDCLVTTINRQKKKNGQLVMGKGIAKEFANYFPILPKAFGNVMTEKSLCPFAFIKGWREGLNLGTYMFPEKEEKVVGLYAVGLVTKNHWKDKSSLELINASLSGLIKFADTVKLRQIVMTRPGCGNGGLDWETEVKPAIKDLLDDRFIIIHKE